MLSGTMDKYAAPTLLHYRGKKNVDRFYRVAKICVPLTSKILKRNENGSYFKMGLNRL
jgi:hypothetical protein